MSGGLQPYNSLTAKAAGRGTSVTRNHPSRHPPGDRGNMNLYFVAGFAAGFAAFPLLAVIVWKLLRFLWRQNENDNDEDDKPDPIDERAQ